MRISFGVKVLSVQVGVVSFSGLDATNPIRPYGAANLPPHVHVNDSANDALLDADA
jgi:hypothetical protein